MIEYVLGFVIDPEDNGLLLIHNNKTQKWNGIGGKKELNESAVSAMEREAVEEAGEQANDWEWEYVGRMLCKDYIIHVLRCFVSLDVFFHHETDEGMVMYHYTVPTYGLDTDTDWLIRMCQSKTKGRFEFTL